MGNQEEKWRFGSCTRERATEKINMVMSFHFINLFSLSTDIKFAVASLLLWIYCFLWSNVIVFASKLVHKLCKLLRVHAVLDFLLAIIVMMLIMYMSRGR